MKKILFLFIIISLIVSLFCFSGCDLISNTSSINTPEAYESCRYQMTKDPSVVWINDVGCTYRKFNVGCITLKQWEYTYNIDYPKNWQNISSSFIEVDDFCEGGLISVETGDYCKGQTPIHRFQNTGSMNIELCWDN